MQFQSNIRSSNRPNISPDKLAKKDVSRRVNSLEPGYRGSQLASSTSNGPYQNQHNRPAHLQQKIISLQNKQNQAYNSQNKFLQLPGKSGYLMGQQNMSNGFGSTQGSMNYQTAANNSQQVRSPKMSGSTNNSRGFSQNISNLSKKNIGVESYESRLLSKYMCPPGLPSTANYSQIKNMVRGNESQASQAYGNTGVYGSMNRRKKQQMHGSSRLPPRQANAKISYRDQSNIMKQIFGNQRLQPQKINRDQGFPSANSRVVPNSVKSQQMQSTPSQHPLKVNPQNYSSENPNKNNRTPKIDEDDVVQKAIFDLQDVKNTYMNDQKEFEQKQATYKTQEGFFNNKAEPGEDMTPKREIKENNFFGRPATEGNMSVTNGFLKRNIQGDLISDPQNNLEGEMENLSKDDLKERLIVAEKVMKSLFQRNKELEEKNNMDQKTTASTSDNHNELQIQQLKKEIARLKEKADVDPVAALSGSLEEDKAFKEMMEKRLKETLEEAKRHYNSYIEIRDQYNNFVEGRINKMIEQTMNASNNAGNQSNRTPGSGMSINNIKMQKIQQDAIQQLKVNLQAQQEMLQDEIKKQSKSFEKIQSQIAQKEQIIKKKDAKIKELNEDIERRQFLEQKVQTYVKNLCAQNQKCKEFIEENIADKDRVQQFMDSIQNCYDEESEEEDEAEGSEDLEL